MVASTTLVDRPDGRVTMSAGGVKSGLSESLARGRLAYDDAEGDLVAENAQLAERMQRLGPALVSTARDLAQARRENAALKRENRRLLARVRVLNETSMSRGATAAVRALLRSRGNGKGYRA